MIYAIILSVIILFWYILFLLFIKNKISKLEKFILQKFKEKNNLIPSIYEVTKKHINKHEEIFNEILILKNKDYSESLYLFNLLERSRTYKLIHKEFDFILRVCSKHNKLEKNDKFTMIKEEIIDKSHCVWENIIKYKKAVKIFNKLINIKNITIVWLLIPINKINSI